MKNNQTGNAKLAATLQSRMQAVNEYASSPSLELARITGNMGLKIDGFPTEIPQGDYLVCRTLKIGNISTGSSGVGVSVSEGGEPPHSHSASGSGHSHSVPLTSEFRHLSAGDRVLVAWASGEPVVIDVI